MKVKICAVLVISFFSAIVAFAQSSSLNQQPSAQYRAAEKAEAALKEKAESERSRSDYLRVIQSYQHVYLITPNTGWADNGLTSIARLYEEIQDPKDAVKTLQFLLREYPQTPFRDVAQRDVARLSRINEATLRETYSVENIRFWEE